MKKITLLIILLCFSFANAQRVAPTFVWANKADYQINGESAVTFKPGEVVQFDLEYTLGTTNAVEDEFKFILVGIQDELEENKPANSSGWANMAIDNTTYKFPGAGTNGEVSTTITIPTDAPLSSSTAVLSYRVNAYLSYTPDGDTQKFGQEGASEPTTVYIRTQAEIDNILSVSSFNKNKLEAYYKSVNSVIVMEKSINEDFSIYNIMGQNVLEGKTSKEINVEVLKPGVYILSTDKGVLKFVK